MDTDQFATDTGDDAAAEESVCVVATRPDTFERCRAGIYPAPASYQRTREPFGYLAFYRTAPISAVTHYAPVVARTEQSRGETGPMDERDWVETIDPFSEAESVVVFELGDLIALETPVENDLHGVRGAWYCSLADLRAAATLSALADAPSRP